MGGMACEDSCKIHRPVWRSEFIGACILLALSFVWFVLCIHGLNTMPKCRYGSNDCYFVVPQKDFQGNNLQMVFKNRAIEGDSDTSLEQLAIPFLVTFASMLAPIL